jgi:hypothetical protein
MVSWGGAVGRETVGRGQGRAPSTGLLHGVGGEQDGARALRLADAPPQRPPRRRVQPGARLVLQRRRWVGECVGFTGHVGSLIL